MQASETLCSQRHESGEALNAALQKYHHILLRLEHKPDGPAATAGSVFQDSQTLAHVDRSAADHFVVKDSTISSAEKGLFSKVHFEKSALLIQYTGERLSPAQANERSQEDQRYQMAVTLRCDTTSVVK